MLLLLLLAAPDTRAFASEYAPVVVEKETLLIQNDRGGKVRCDPPYQEELDTFVPQLVRAVGKYGAQAFGKMRIRRFVLCRDLAWRFDKPRKRTVNGVVDVREEQGVPAFARYDDQSIYFDVARLIRSRSVEACVHHELFHFLDYNHPGRRTFESTWTRSNAANFRYGTGGMDRQDQYDLGMGAAPPGFVSQYSTSSIWEDKAEVFEKMVTQPTAVAKRAKNDPVLATKVKLMREMIEAFSEGLSARLPR